MADSSPKSLSLGVCLYNGLTCLDFQGVVENLCLLTKQQRARIMPNAPGPEMASITYLADTLDPVKPGFSGAWSATLLLEDAHGRSGEAGPRLLPDATYSETTQQFDILLIPGGGYVYSASNSYVKTVPRD